MWHVTPSSANDALPRGGVAFSAEGGIGAVARVDFNEPQTGASVLDSILEDINDLYVVKLIVFCEGNCAGQWTPMRGVQPEVVLVDNYDEKKGK